MAWAGCAAVGSDCCVVATTAAIAAAEVAASAAPPAPATAVAAAPSVPTPSAWLGPARPGAGFDDPTRDSGRSSSSELSGSPIALSAAAWADDAGADETSGAAPAATPSPPSLARSRVSDRITSRSVGSVTAKSPRFPPAPTRARFLYVSTYPWMTSRVLTLACFTRVIALSSSCNRPEALPWDTVLAVATLTGSALVVAWDGCVGAPRLAAAEGTC